MNAFLGSAVSQLGKDRLQAITPAAVVPRYFTFHKAMALSILVDIVIAFVAIIAPCNHVTIYNYTCLIRSNSANNGGFLCCEISDLIAPSVGTCPRLPEDRRTDLVRSPSLLALSSAVYNRTSPRSLLPRGERDL